VNSDAPERILRAGMLPGLVDAAIDGTGPGGRVRRTARDLLVDAVFVLLAAGMGLVGLLAPGAHGTAYTVVSVVALVSSCLALLVRRRFAVSLAAVLIVASVWLPVVSGASLIALFTAAVHRRIFRVLPLVALAALSTLVQLRVGPTLTEPLYWPAVGVTVLITLLVVGWGVATRARRQVVVMMAERIRRLRAEQEARLRAARQAVRERTARDMHDSLAHRLSLITMSAGTLEFRDSTSPEDRADMIGIVRTNAQLALAELRQVVSALRDEAEGDAAEAAPGGTARLAERVAGLVEQARDSGQRVEYHWRVPDDLPDDLGESVFRVVQEALSNARKHAPASAATMIGAHDGEEITVDVVNERGPERHGPGGQGLRGMTERVEAAGGTVSVVDDRHRFHLCAHWPLPGADRGEGRIRVR
jgi:signal transduction histidine kinase